MERRQESNLNTIMQEMRDQQAKREEELQKILLDKQKEIESLRETESDRSQIASQLKQMFQEERAGANAEMQDFLKTFQKQKEETAARLANLPPEYRAELEEQKNEARRAHDLEEAKELENNPA